MNRARYDSLPAELKRVIDANSGAEASAWVGKVFDAARAAGRKSAVEQGNQIHVIVPQDMKSWFDAGDRVAAQWVEETEAKGYPATEILARTKAELDR